MAVVNSVNARHPAEVYRFPTEELGCARIQWLPCAEPKGFRTVAPARWDTTKMPILGTPAARPGHPDSVVTDWSVDPDDWGEFLCQTFDLWLKTGLGKVSVNWFETLVGLWMNEPSQICNLAPQQVPDRARERRQPLFVRTVRVPGIPVGHPARCELLARRRRVLAAATGVRLQQGRHAHRLLQALSLPLCVPRRMSLEPVHQVAGRPARTELPMLWAQAFLCLRRSLSAADRRPSAAQERQG